MPDHIIFALRVAESATRGLGDYSRVLCNVVDRGRHGMPQQALLPLRNSTFGRGFALSASLLCIFQHVSRDEK